MLLGVYEYVRVGGCMCVKVIVLYVYPVFRYNNKDATITLLIFVQ